MSGEPSGGNLDELVDELARVFHEAGGARELVLRAGFPLAGVPAFDVPMVFWSRVVRDAEAGRSVGGVRKLVELAAAQLPGNQFLTAYRSRCVDGSGTNAPPSTRAVDNRGASISQQIVVQGDATFGPMTVRAAAPGDARPPRSGRDHNAIDVRASGLGGRTRSRPAILDGPAPSKADRALRVFVSSTFIDNKDRRRVVEDAILSAGMVPVGMERFTASTRPTVEECLEQVRGCDWLVGVLAYRYGWIPPGQPEGQERSITEMEYDAAKAAEMPRLMFVIDGSIKVDPNADFDAGPDRWKKQDKLDAFKGKIGADQMPAPFREETLGTRVLQAIFEERQRQARPRGSRQQTTTAIDPGGHDEDDNGSPVPRVELDSYLVKIESLHCELRLAGFETKVRVPIGLEELYEPLDAMMNRGAERRHVFKTEDGLEGHDAQVELASAFEVAGRQNMRGVVLLGEPGSGKTTHLRQVLLKVVRDGAESIGLPPGIVPVFLPLRRLRDLEAGLPRFIEQELRDPLLGVEEGFGKRLCQRSKLLFLLDGLDEVANAEHRERVARWIEDARRAWPSNYFLVSCRFSGYTPDAQLDEGFLELGLRPMSPAQVESFVRKWYGIVERATNPDPAQAQVKAEAGADDLLTTLRKPEMRSARVYTMTHNPLLLTTICLVHRDRGTLPDKRVVLYEEAVSVLLERWRRVTKELNVTFPTREALQVLMPVAGWMHEQIDRTQATANELQVPVAEGLAAIGRADVPARTFLETIRDESGLLTGWGVDEFGFMHLGFQEYLAARRIQARAFEHPELLTELAGCFEQSWWQEVILLLLAQDHPPMFKRFMGELVKRAEFPEWARSELMGLCWTEAFGVNGEPFVELLRQARGDESLGTRQLAVAELLALRIPAVLDGLEELLRQHPSELVRRWWQARKRQAEQLKTKVVAGVELVLLPAGRFVMGSPDDEVGRDDDETPHTVTLSSFYLARTPVSNAQYREYMKANPVVKEPKYWGDRQFNQDTQPVVGVSWHEARAYCEWAGLLLPTEAQWEYACRAGTQSEYCSGNGEECLTKVGWFNKSSGGRLHGVGELAPNAWGLYDMHGNVWEWCEDAFGDYSTSPRVCDGLRHEPAGGAYRVMRGGDFDEVASVARSAYRYRHPPDGRWGFVGFRPAQGHP